MEKGDAGGVHRKTLEKALNEFRGAVSQEYPPYSSKTVEGKSLIEWARSGAIHTMVLPRRTVTIYDIGLTSMYKVDEPTLLNYIESNVNKVQGDFRQDETVRLWKQNLRKEGAREFPCATITISCSSGTYARSIAHGLGAELGVPALALRILRTQVGEYTLERAMR
jgi:tRNA pseudouridine(55) synthase